jgi:hypothetical protein
MKTIKKLEEEIEDISSRWKDLPNSCLGRINMQKWLYYQK